MCIKANLDILKRSSNLELLVHLHPYCMSYAVFDRDLNQILDFDAKVVQYSMDKFIAVESISNWFFDNKQVFSLNFKSTKISIYSPIYTILPDKTDKQNEIFAMLGYENDTRNTYLKNQINASFYVYFALPDKTINFIENHLPNVEFYFADYGLLSFYNNRLSFKKYLAANLYGEELTICYKADGQNLYLNKFPIKAKEDLLYYLRLAYEHLNLDANEFPTYLYGFVEEKSPMYTTTYGFIRNFEIDRTLKITLPFKYAMEDFPFHYYINLLGLGL
ncbi:MAG: DUF3822 family protein [Chitinophagales bacterium]|nr:DUF3822 family protein [Saprospirales bacterium]MBK8352147.1 DUF3822 family protein [Saprospirales bacterium]MBP6661362.1 DUF3822 family protein [Chitinophagales bacterium]